LLSAKDGEPLSVEVFEGNTTDPQTLGSQVEKLTERFQVKEVVLVGDRGMIKAQGKERLNQAHLKYITALTDPQIRKLIKQEVFQPDLFDEHVAEIHHQDKRLILRCDPATQRKERHRREDKLQRLRGLIEERNRFVAQSPRAKPEAGLKNLQGWARRHKIAGFADLTLTGRVIELHIDEPAKQDAELLDGCYCIETDVPSQHLSKDEVHDRYKDLQQVERDFRRLKTGFLEVRPVFVRKAPRTRGHVFIAMLSLRILRLMEQRLHSVFGTTNDHDQAETVDSALTALSRLCLQHYQIGEQQIVGLPRPDSRQQQILSALQVTLTAP
jgi:transposase